MIIFSDPIVRDAVAEMKHRACGGCTGDDDGVCCDPDLERHPEDWCDYCLMGKLVMALETESGNPSA